MMDPAQSTSDWSLWPTFWGVDTTPIGIINESLAKKAQCLYVGRNRNVFDVGRYVIKTPINAAGNSDNAWEGSLGNSARQLENPNLYIQYPKTRLFCFDEFFILLMEKVVPVDWGVSKYSDYPKWVDAVDCGQVGHTKHGRLVVYDYGTN